jgi:hypothetical protein
MPSTTRAWASVPLAIAILVAPLSGEQQPELSAEAVATIKRDVTAAVNKYYRLFTEQNPTALAEDVFNIPWLVLGGSGPQPDLTREAAVARFQASMKQLVESGWAKSVFTTENVCVLNANAAIASGYNTRYRKDGTVMSVGGVSYLFGKAKDGWRIVSYTAHAKDKVVRCD